jgi:hypothetical protein
LQHRPLPHANRMSSFIQSGWRLSRSPGEVFDTGLCRLLPKLQFTKMLP